MWQNLYTLVALAGLLLAPAVARSLTLRPMKFSEIVHESRVVAVVRIDGERNIPDPGDTPRGMPATGYGLEVLETWAGDAADVPREIHLPGGKRGDRRMFIPGMPRFEPGKRYVLFLRADESGEAASIVGVTHGAFEVVEPEEQDGEAILNDMEGREIEAIADDRIVRRTEPAVQHSEPVMYFATEDSPAPRAAKTAQPPPEHLTLDELRQAVRILSSERE